MNTEPKLSTWWRKIRITRDTYCGFEVQCKYVWWPFWIQFGATNTHFTIEAAKKYAEDSANPTYL